jgi:phosphoglycerate dehydrogenase-like enzyme
MAPRVLISDDLSPAAVQIFRDRGVEVDFQPKLGRDKDALLAAIPLYDGLAIRSATKATKSSSRRHEPQGHRPGRASAWTTWTCPPPPSAASSS